MVIKLNQQLLVRQSVNCAGHDRSYLCLISKHQSALIQPYGNAGATQFQDVAVPLVEHLDLLRDLEGETQSVLIPWSCHARPLHLPADWHQSVLNTLASH